MIMIVMNEMAVHAGKFEEGKKYKIQEVSKNENQVPYCIVKDEEGKDSVVNSFMIKEMYDENSLERIGGDPFEMLYQLNLKKDRKDTIDGSYVKAGRDRRAEAYQAIIDHKNGEKDLRIQILQDQIKELKFKLELEKDMNEKLIARVLRLEEL